MPPLAPPAPPVPPAPIDVGDDTPRGEAMGANAMPAVPTTPPDAPYHGAGAIADGGAGGSSADFDTPAVVFASAHAARMAQAQHARGGGGGGGGGTPGALSAAAFAPSFAPTGDLSAGVVRQRRELHVLPSARVVLLEEAGLGDEHADEVADYLRDNARTELLHLGRNELTDAGVCAIASTLPTCAVRRLSLAGNNLQDEGALALADALADGFAPEQLDLSDNMITDEGALALISKATAHAQHLRWLDLSLNPLISDAGRAAAAAASVGASFDLQV